VLHRRGRGRPRGARVGQHPPAHHALLASSAAASIPGALIGARLTGRLSEIQLVRAIAGVLLVAGIATGVQAVA
jgi:uncharacterized membrane protein YfcA